MTSASQSKVVPLYQQLLGPAWNQLAPAIRQAHQVAEHLDSAGHFDIAHGSNPLARLLVRIMRMPPAGQAVPTRLRMSRQGSFEQWSRTFANVPLQSLQHIREDHVLVERFDGLQICFKLEVRAGGICYRQHQTAVRVVGCWLPLPVWLSPQIDAEEMPGQMPNESLVCVAVRFPRIGLLLEYRGQMQTQEIGT